MFRPPTRDPQSLPLQQQCRTISSFQHNNTIFLINLRQHEASKLLTNKIQDIKQQKNRKNIFRIKNSLSEVRTTIWVFPKIGVKPLKWMVKIMENPYQNGMIWGENPLFLVTSISSAMPGPNLCGNRLVNVFHHGRTAPSGKLTWQLGGKSHPFEDVSYIQILYIQYDSCLKVGIFCL